MYLNIHAINPYIRVAMPSILAPGTEIKRRAIFDYELLYIENGEFILNYNECDYPCTQGQFILLRPGVSHSFTKINSELSQPHIHFDMLYSSKSTQTPVSFKDVPEFTPKEHNLLQKDIFEDYPSTPFIVFSDKQRALKLFYGIIGESSANRLAQKAKFLEIIDMMISDNFPACFSKEDFRYGIAYQLKEYIDAGQGVSARLSDLEKQFSYSKYYLERQFKKHFGISLIAYRNTRRMDLAEKLLQRETVSCVSANLGFSSVYAFSRAFKQHFGISPSKLKILKQQTNGRNP